MAEKLREGHYDLLTTDLKMQDASGYEVLELLRTSDIGNSRTIPVMVVTGSKSITKEELAGAGFGSVLYKPFSIDELLAAAEECIGEDSTPRAPYNAVEAASFNTVIDSISAELIDDKSPS